MNEPNQVEVQEVRTDVVITEPIGSLSKEDVQKLVSLILGHLKKEQDTASQRDQDTAISNRVYPPAVR
jgi:hypothetical protein